MLADRRFDDFASAAATAACTGGTGASVFLSPSGSDSSPCTQSAPCQSFDRAYHVAPPGQIVQIAGGSYGGQLTNWLITQTDRFKAALPAAVVASSGGSS